MKRVQDTVVGAAEDAVGHVAETVVEKAEDAARSLLPGTDDEPA